MRELKFRVWQSVTKKMYTWPDVRMKSAGGGWTIICDGQCMGLKYVDIMQYTGMKDKNGEAVWEGDIILYPWSTGTYSKGIIEFKVSKWRSPGFTCVTIGDDENGDEISFDSRCEVIGNIHENPELLESK